MCYAFSRIAEIKVIFLIGEGKLELFLEELPPTETNISK